MDKDDKDIRKEIEDLEKLIDQVKKQNEEERKKHQKTPRNTVVRINLATVYSTNFWINMVFSVLVNFIVIFGVLKLFNFAEVTNDVNIIFLVLIFTAIEELYKKFLVLKHLKIVIYTSGLIFTFINLLLFYFLDLVLFQEAFSFVNPLYPIAFIVLFQLARAIIKNIYFRIMNYMMLKKIKK